MLRYKASLTEFQSTKIIIVSKDNGTKLETNDIKIQLNIIKGENITLNTYIRKEAENNDLNNHFKKLGKNSYQIKPKESRKKINRNIYIIDSIVKKD